MTPRLTDIENPQGGSAAKKMIEERRGQNPRMGPRRRVRGGRIDAKVRTHRVRYNGMQVVIGTSGEVANGLLGRCRQSLVCDPMVSEQLDRVPGAYLAPVSSSNTGIRTPNRLETPKTSSARVHSRARDRRSG
jgi:hypothetical protein